MRLIAKAEDREYLQTCHERDAVFAYTKKDVQVREMDIDDFNWLGMRKKTKIHLVDKFVMCPNCGKRNYLIE